MKTTGGGKLYIVATPIGNLQDMTLRAIETLKNVAFIVAEDKRHCKVLLTHYGIKTPVLSLNQQNERAETEGLLARLEAGSDLALISDAGTPLISDPGYSLVKAARLAGFQVLPIPGACAAIAALSASGLATDRFVFVGFLSAKAGPRTAALEALSAEESTLVFYEAPHRIRQLLEALIVSFGPDRKAVLARELTKMFETIQGGGLAEILAWVESDSNQERGEIVLMVEGALPLEKKMVNKTSEEILDLLLKECPLNQAVKLTVAITGEKRNKLYQQAINQLKK